MRLPTDSEKDLLLAQILQSPEFHDSKRYQELLKYLVDKSTKVESLKEIEIAQEVFGKDSKFDPSSDPLIRVHISNLRKKLEHYYLTTEDRPEFKLEIPKGQYLVKYSTNSSRKAGSHRATLPGIPIGIIVVLCAVIVLREFFRNEIVPTPPAPIGPNSVWNEFLTNNDRPTMVVLGDFLVLSEKGKTEGRTFLREPRINSEQELRNLAKLHPDKYGKYQISDVSYVGTGVAVGLSEIIRIVSASAKPFFVKLSSQLKWDDFENYNIVYVGTLKTLDKLDTLFSRTNLRFRLNPNSLHIADARKDSSLDFSLDWQGGSYQKDFSIVLKMPGSRNNSMIFLTGFSEVGIMESIKLSADSTLMSRIAQFSGSAGTQAPNHFELISQVEGVGHTVFRSEMRYFSRLTEPNR